MCLEELIVESFNKIKIEAKQEAYKEVLEWLGKLTIDDADGCGHPIVSFTYFESKEQMFQSFKEQFNIE